MDSHYRERPCHRDKHRLGRQGFDPHRRDGGWPGLDMDGQSLDEIRRKVRGAERDDEHDAEEARYE